MTENPDKLGTVQLEILQIACHSGSVHAARAWMALRVHYGLWTRWDHARALLQGLCSRGLLRPGEGVEPEYYEPTDAAHDLIERLIPN